MADKIALVVDDSRVARMLLNRLLQAQGFTVVEHESAEGALQWLQADPRQPDIIFMDLMMPGMDGITATREIKSRHALQTVPVVVCTGNDGDTDKNAALASGAMAVLSKPPAAEALNGILLQLAASKEQVAPTEPAPARFDETMLLDKFLEAAEQQWLPGVKQQIQQFAEDICQQTASEVALQAAEQKLQSLSVSLVPQWQQEMQSSLQEELQTIQQQLAKEQHAKLHSNAINAIESALLEFGLTEKLKFTLREETEHWLLEQQQRLQSKLEHQIAPMIESTVSQQLDQRLATILAEQSDSEDKRFSKLSLLHQRSTQQLGVVKTIAIASTGIAFVALIIALL